MIPSSSGTRESQTSNRHDRPQALNPRGYPFTSLTGFNKESEAVHPWNVVQRQQGS